MKINIILKIWYFFFGHPKHQIPADEFGGYLIPEIWRIERRKILEGEVKRLNLMGFSKQAKRLERKLKREGEKNARNNC